MRTKWKEEGTTQIFSSEPERMLIIQDVKMLPLIHKGYSPENGLLSGYV